MKQTFKTTGNDVLDFSRYFNGNNEPPLFRKQYIDFKNKLFIHVDDPGLFVLSNNLKKNVILHHFVEDKKQNSFVMNKNPPLNLYQKAYAVTSSDLSVDSLHTFKPFNDSNILKARINAYRLQNEFDLLVILTLIWGDRSTFEWAFNNIEKGSDCAVSSQSIKDEKTFREGFIYSINKIQPEHLCWYGIVFDWVKEYYDLKRIVKMQTRTQLIQQKQILLENGKQLEFKLH